MRYSPILAARALPGRTKEFLEGFSRLSPRVMGVKSIGGGLWLPRVARANERSEHETDEYEDDDDNDGKEPAEGSDRHLAPPERRKSKVGRRRRDGGRQDGGSLVVPDSRGGGGGASIRGGGRLGRLEGVPFQTLRIDLFVEGSPSLHSLLVVVDHILKLFQRGLLPRRDSADPRGAREGARRRDEGGGGGGFRRSDGIDEGCTMARRRRRGGRGWVGGRRGIRARSN